MLYIDSLELDESIENSTLSVVSVDRDKAKRLEMLQNKILVVRCISYTLSVLRCVVVVLLYVLTRPLLTLSASHFAFFVRSVKPEHRSELKNILRSSSLSYGVLSLRDEEAKNAIKLFNETCVISFPFLLRSGQY